MLSTFLQITKFINMLSRFFMLNEKKPIFEDDPDVADANA